MGSGTSKQRLGERVLEARKQLAAAKHMQAARASRLKAASPDTLEVLVQSVSASLLACDPCSDAMLLVAFEANPEEMTRVLRKTCKKVLSAPIVKEEYMWFMRSLFPSSIWMQSHQNKFLFQEMLDITLSMTQKIDKSMQSIYQHLTTHTEWSNVVVISNETIVARQDDDRVGLLRDQGIRDMVDVKDEDSAEQEQEGDDLQTFVDSNLAVNVLTMAARRINAEFQSCFGMVMSRYGDFKAGPIKTVERCQSKLENDYHDAVYPKAARLLDLVRCSVSFNTLEQLLEGYQGLRRHIKTSSDSLELARVKNGFLDKEADFRDIKVNIVFHSETDPDHPVSMVCEVQLILNQYLHEKKRIHKLYSILRERKYFEMVVQEDDEEAKPVKELKALQFEPVLNVKEQVQLSYAGTSFYKCSVDSELGLLGISCADDGAQFFCVDLKSKKVVFEYESSGYHTHHWVVLNKQKYLTLQTKKNEIKMFSIDEKDKSFSEDKQLRVSMGPDDEICYSEFDRKFKYIFILKNLEVLEKRSIGDVNVVMVSFMLEEKVKLDSLKQLSLSNDGTFCAIGGGKTADFYLIDLENKEQHKLTSVKLTLAYSPCFINGDTEYLAVGGHQNEGVEIWDVKNKQSARVLKMNDKYTGALTSTNNILAVWTRSYNLQLWDVRNWEMFHLQMFDGMSPRSLHLTADSRYLTLGGRNGDKCVVLQIE